MGSFEDGHRRLALLAASLADLGRATLNGALDPEALRGQVFRRGDQVRDRVTGQGGTVEHSSFVHATLEATGRGGD
jgi:hypothetical protein